MKRFVLVILLLLVALAVVPGAEANYGFYSNYNYTGYGNGYYLIGNQYYTRSYGSYFVNGCTYCFYYVPYVAPYVAPTPAVPFDHKAALAALAKQKIDKDEFIEGLAKLGFAPAPQGPLVLGSPYGGGYSVNGSSYYNTYPVSGSTVYGYGVQSYNQQLAQQQPQRDNTDLLAQISSQLIAGGTDTGGKLFGVLQRQEESKAELARNLVRLEMHRQSLFAIAPSAAVQSGTRVTVTPTPTATLVPVLPKPSPGPTADADHRSRILAAWVADAKTDCASCHIGPKAAGGFDLEAYPAMTQAEREKRVYPRIDPKAPDSFRMPRNADGTPGTPFTPERVALWKAAEDVK